MSLEYSTKNDKWENLLYNILKRIRRTPALYLGEASLTKLFQFIGGYEYAMIDLVDYRPHFDKEFQTFTEQKYQRKGPQWHWNTIIGEEKTEEEAFFAFYDQLDEFLKKKRLS